MYLHRCPWCGEKLPFYSRLIRKGYQYNLLRRCPKCKKQVTEKVEHGKYLIITMSLLLLQLSIFFIMKNLQFPWLFSCVIWILGIILLIFNLIRWYQQPFERYGAKPGTVKCKSSATIFLKWEKYKKRGLLFPILQAPNGEIFPACFMDEKGAPISRALCVVLDNIKWSGSRSCKCTIQLVLDDIEPETYFQKGNRLNLYCDYRKIAEGVVE